MSFGSHLSDVGEKQPLLGSGSYTNLHTSLDDVINAGRDQLGERTSLGGRQVQTSL